MLGNDPEELEIFLGTDPCYGKQASDNEVTCELGLPYAGKRPLSLTIYSLGKARINESVQFIQVSEHGRKLQGSWTS